MAQAPVPAPERWKIEDELRVRVQAAIAELREAVTEQQKKLAVDRLTTATEQLTAFVLRGQLPPSNRL